MSNNVIKINRLLKKFEGKTNTPVKQATTAFERWINQVVTPKQDANSTNYSESVTNKNYCILYYLEIKYIEHSTPIIEVHIKAAAKLKKGSYSGAIKKFSIYLNTHFQAIIPEDSSIIHRLELKTRTNHRAGSNACTYRDNYLLTSEDGEIFEDLIKTNRCYWINNEAKLQLQLGEKRNGQMEWLINDFAEQKLACKIDEQLVIVLPFAPVWYLNNLGICGKLELGLNQGSEKLLFMPPLLPQDISKMNGVIKKHFPKQAEAIPSPTTFKVINEIGRASCRERVCLYV